MKSPITNNCRHETFASDQSDHIKRRQPYLLWLNRDLNNFKRFFYIPDLSHIDFASYIAPDDDDDVVDVVDVVAVVAVPWKPDRMLS